MKFTIEQMSKMAVLLQEVTDHRSVEQIEAEAFTQMSRYAAFGEVAVKATVDGLTLDEWTELRAAHEAYFGYESRV